MEKKKKMHNIRSKSVAETLTTEPQKKFFNNPNKYYPLLIAAFTFLIYLISIGNDFVIVWDDGMYILKNEILKNLNTASIKTIFTSFYHGNYHPLTTLLFAIEFNIWGMKAAPYHFISMLLHIANAILVYALIKKFTDDYRIAAVVSLLFAIHPMHVESVAWISEQKDLLYSLFYLASLIFYLNYTSGQKQNKNYLLALVFFTLSCLSKSMAVTMPIIIILFDVYQGRRMNLKAYLEKIPFLAIGILFGFIALKSQSIDDPILNVSAVYSFTDRFFLISYAIVQYFLKLFIPFGFSAIHYYPSLDISGFLPWYYYFSPLVYLVFALIIYKSRQYRKDIVAGLVFFFVTISIVLQIIPAGQALFAERYTYIPYLGLFFIIASIIFKTPKSTAVNFANKIKQYLIPVLIFYVIVLSISTIRRIPVWENGITLFTDVIEKYPNHYFGYWIRGNQYTNLNMPDFNAAEMDFNKSMELNPEYKAALMELGLIKYASGRNKEAYNDFNEVIKSKPDFAEGYTNRGMVRAGMNDLDGALEDFNKAIELKPDLVQPHSNRGLIYERKNNHEEAIKSFDLAIKINPDWAELYNNRALSKFAYGDTSGACVDWRTGKEMGSKNASLNLSKFCR